MSQTQRCLEGAVEHQIQTLDFHQNVLAHDVTLSKSLLLCGSQFPQPHNKGGMGWRGVGGLAGMASGPFWPCEFETQPCPACPTHILLCRHHSDHFLSEQDLTEGAPPQLWFSLPCGSPHLYPPVPPTLPFCSPSL